MSRRGWLIGAAGALVLGFAGAAWSTQPAAEAPPTPFPQDTVRPSSPRYPWVVGERFEYNAKFGIFNVGRASIEVLGIDTVRGVPSYHALFAIHGRALVYQLTDSLESWFSVDSLVSRRFHQNGSENGRAYTRNFEIFADRGMWIYNGRDSGTTVARPLDETSFFFFVRTLDLEDGHTYDLNRYFRSDRSLVTIRVLGRQSVNTPAGRFDAVMVRPIFQSSGIFSQGGEATVWFSDDSLRIPLRIRSRMSIGSLDLSLRHR